MAFDPKSILSKGKDLANTSSKWLTDILDLKAEKPQSVVEEVEEETEIPEAYVQRFHLHPLEEFSQLEGREEEFKLMQRAYENWKISRSPLLMIGEFGAGMTSLLNAGSSIYPHARIMANNVNIDTEQSLVEALKKAMDYPEARTLNDLKTLPAGEGQRVIIFENIERLFLRKIHGFNLLEDFLLLVHATKQNIFWIATINKYSFYYLNEVIGFGSNFLSIIRLQPMKPEIIEQIITNRNAGYEVIYLKPPTSTAVFSQNLERAASEGKQFLLKNDFFSKLHTFSDGNISRAMLYWKRSLLRVKEKRIYVKAHEEKIINSLTLEELFVLEAILQHTSLSSAELRMILRNSSKGSKLILEKLLENNLLYVKHYEGSTEPEYQVNLFFLKQVKNQIHSRLNRNIQ